MSHEPSHPSSGEPPSEPVLSSAAADAAKRKQRAREEKRHGVWFGMGVFGLIGWSVATPMLLGILLGVWIDARWPSRFSWTLMLLVGGLLIGCWNAWYWLEKERKALRRGGSDDQ